MTQMWEILVPTEKPDSMVGKKRFISTRYHQEWDNKVRAITGGLTVMRPAKGQWVSPSGQVFIERMIPVRIACTRTQIEQIIQMTIKHYQQEAVLAYKISEEVILRHATHSGIV